MIPGIMRDMHDTHDLRMTNLIYAGITHDTLDLRVIYAWYSLFTFDLRMILSIYAWFSHDTSESEVWFTRNLRMIPGIMIDSNTLMI